MSKHYRILLGTIALSALLLSGCAKGGTDASAGSVSGSEAASGSSSVSEPSAAPITFEGADLDGNAVTSDIFSQSKLTMVNVWATYCNPCLRACLISSDEDGNEGESKNLSRNNKFTLTIFPKPAEFV